MSGPFFPPGAQRGTGESPTGQPVVPLPLADAVSLLVPAAAIPVPDEWFHQHIEKPTLPTRPGEILRNSTHQPYTLALIAQGLAEVGHCIDCVVDGCRAKASHAVELWMTDSERLVRHLACCDGHGRTMVTWSESWTLHETLGSPPRITFNEAGTP